MKKYNLRLKTPIFVASKNTATMSLSMLSAISPIDGRYRSKTNTLADFFSEESLIKYRVLVEINISSHFVKFLYLS